MVECYKPEDPPYKLLARDLMKCQKAHDDGWNLRLCGKNIVVKNVWLQGFIEETMGAKNDELIMRDHTGKVKILKCSSVPGDNSWLSKGIYCSVIGKLIEQSNLPHVAALKLTRLDENPVHASLWPNEVKEMKLLLTNQAAPCI